MTIGEVRWYRASYYFYIWRGKMTKRKEEKEGNAVTSQFIFNREAFLKRWEKEEKHERK